MSGHIATTGGHLRQPRPSTGGAVRKQWRTFAVHEVDVLSLCRYPLQSKAWVFSLNQ